VSDFRLNPVLRWPWLWGCGGDLAAMGWSVLYGLRSKGGSLCGFVRALALVGFVVGWRAAENGQEEVTGVETAVGGGSWILGAYEDPSTNRSRGRAEKGRIF